MTFDAGSSFLDLLADDFGAASVSDKLVITSSHGKLAEVLTPGAELCKSFSVLRGMEAKILSLQRGSETKLTISSIALLSKKEATSKITLSINWRAEHKLFEIRLYPSSDECEQDLLRASRFRRVLERLPPMSAESKFEDVRHAGQAADRRDPAKRAFSPLTCLTSREREVVALLADGNTNKGVARILGLSPKTIEVHRAEAMRRLNIKTAAELFKVAIVHGLVPSDLPGKQAEKKA
jgi:DNA-binding CsgD family transcriptional regulator